MLGKDFVVERMGRNTCSAAVQVKAVKYREGNMLPLMKRNVGRGRDLFALIAL